MQIRTLGATKGRGLAAVGWLTLIALVSSCGEGLSGAPHVGEDVASDPAPSGRTNAPPPSSPLDDTAPPPGATDPPATGNSPWCEALAVVRNDCQGCHGSERKFGAPMSLVSYDDFNAPAVSDSAKAVYELVSRRIHDAQRPMPPSGLSAADTAVLDAWIAAGAEPGADLGCGAGEVPVVPEQLQPAEPEWPADCEEFFTLTTHDLSNAAEKYSVSPGGEEHPQFVFDAPWGNDHVQVLAYRPVTDNAKVLHHWILYENSGGLGAKFLVGWAPGSDGSAENLPNDVGMYMPGGSAALRLDVHYYNLGSTQAELDSSGLELCVTRTLRPITATVIGLTGNATANPGRSDNSTPCTANVSGGANVRFLSVSPHMHKLGVHGKLELTRNGQKTSLHDAAFDFLDQRVYPLDQIQIKSGDVLTTTCSYENDTGRVVRFGQNSDDEMCFNFVTYYPMGSFGCGFAL